MSVNVSAVECKDVSDFKSVLAFLDELQDMLDVSMALASHHRIDDMPLTSKLLFDSIESVQESLVGYRADFCHSHHASTTPALDAATSE